MRLRSGKVLCVGDVREFRALLATDVVLVRTERLTLGGRVYVCPQSGIELLVHRQRQVRSRHPATVHQAVPGQRVLARRGVRVEGEAIARREGTVPHVLLPATARVEHGTTVVARVPNGPRSLVPVAERTVPRRGPAVRRALPVPGRRVLRYRDASQGELAAGHDVGPVQIDYTTITHLCISI